jgi:serine phosphatase RsbU (regulator of sigma subunit)
VTRASTAPATDVPEPRPAHRFPVIVVGIAVLVVGTALTVALSITSYRLNRHNEHRLLDLQVKQTAAALQAALPSIETPLASAAQGAVTNHGGATAFRKFITQFVGAPPGKSFVSASLWRYENSSLHLIKAVGQPRELPSSASGSRALIAAAKASNVFLVGPLDKSSAAPRLGIAYAAGKKVKYIVYAESALPKNRHAEVQSNSPFADLRFALYLGQKATPSTLLETNQDRLPLTGDTVTTKLMFGASEMILVGGSDRQLSGSLSGRLWWIVAIAGAVLTLLAALLADRLARARRIAERSAERSQDQLTEQRGIALAIQQALLPEAIAQVPGLASGARYVAGAEGVDIGGDWYDLLPLPDGRVFFVVGDVSGRGVHAGTTMAALRFAAHAFVSEYDEPNVVLERLGRMIDVTRGGQFATVLCGVLDVAKHEVVLANAGHLPPLLIADGVGRYLDTALGPPLGATARPTYRTVTVRVPAHATLLSFTDGLVERSGRTLDESLEQLRATLESVHSLNEVFDRLVSGVVGETNDDIAILGVQWLG